LRVDPHYVVNLAAAIDQSSSLESSLTTELSSGLRVTSLQVDPGAVAKSALIAGDIARDDTYVQSASGKQGLLQVTDSTLGEVVTQLTSAVTLAVQGSNGTLTSSNISVIAQQLTGIRDQVLSLANSSYLGSHLFGGSQGSSKPYSVDTTTVPATTTYSGDGVVQYMETPNGQNIQVNLPGSAIFGSGSTGLLPVLNQLIADFSSGTASASAASDASALTAALSQVSSQRSILGSSLSRLQQTSAYAQTEVSELTAEQGTLVSADLATIATDLKSAETQHQALLSVTAALGSSNLFNYMK
jgi:flagellar hook-associated protein 3 FlgL